MADNTFTIFQSGADRSVRQVLSGVLKENYRAQSKDLLEAEQTGVLVQWPTEHAVQSVDLEEVVLWQAPEQPSYDQGGAAQPAAVESLYQPQGDQVSSESALQSSEPYAANFSFDTDYTADDTSSAARNFPDSQATSQATFEHPALYAQAVPTVLPKKRSYLRAFLLGIMIVSLVVVSSVVIPELYYWLRPESIEEVATLPSQADSAAVAPVVPPAPQLPAVDPSLPAGEWLRIPSIGVDAGVQSSLNPDEALEKGAWRVPDFGSPDDFSQPTIIASHRFGWVWWWQSDFGKKNSFYYLPETTIGDRIEVIAGQRRYTYEIYAKEEGQVIRDYEADLILYTCKFMNSPERYFVYAKRLPSDSNPAANSLQPGAAAHFDNS